MTLLVASFAIVFISSRAEILHVPADYTTIQTALDAVDTYDTILVAPGRYHEFLVGPLHSYFMFGQYSPDSVAEELWTVLDPIPLPDADTPSAFVARGDTVLIKNFAFFNRAEMRQPDWPTRTGGIRNQSDFLIVEQCRFDSVSAAIERGPYIRALHCEFRGCLWKCIWTEQWGRLEARHCYFDGESGYAYILAYDHTTLDSCVFGCNPTGHFVGLGTRHIRVRDCVFGPCAGAFSTLFLGVSEDVLVERCTFVEIDSVSIILQVDVRCTESLTPPIILRNNMFREFDGVNYAMSFWCQSDCTGFIGLCESNAFTDGVAQIHGGAINVSGIAMLHGNTFHEILPNEQADVYADNITSLGALTARDNQFLGPGLGAATNGPPFDARWNWWGDSTGPYSPSENPEGLGTEVGWGVEFQPWLTSPPDTIGDTSEVAVETPPSMLANYSLHAYPNPFNAVTTLEIDVVVPGEYDVLLYDVTGREAARVFSGRIERSARVALNASEYASGVYFVKLARGSQMFAVEKLMLVK
ncbi:MAG: T9SS type A sorting domain-containing protein [bacterium]|nr:T9SS type A sorting domain-containing protein [bacterium]